MIGSASWSIGVGILVLIVAIIFAALYYLRYKKVFLVIYISSIATYIFAVLYTWDIFEINENGILGLLLISTLLMLFLGKYTITSKNRSVHFEQDSKSFKKIELKPSKVYTSLKEKKWMRGFYYWFY